MNFDKEKLIDFLSESATKVREVATDTKETVVAHYHATKLNGELEDLFIELGILVNRAYNHPGSTAESEVVSLNEKINQKAKEVERAKSVASDAAGK